MRSKILGISTVIATAYVAYLMVYFSGAIMNSEGMETVGASIATALVTPHIVMFAIGVIFGWVGFLGKTPWAALVAAILYSVGTVLFLMYAMFGIPILILGFVGYSKQKKLNSQEEKIS